MAHESQIRDDRSTSSVEEDEAIFGTEAGPLDSTFKPADDKGGNPETPLPKSGVGSPAKPALRDNFVKEGDATTNMQKAKDLEENEFGFTPEDMNHMLAAANGKSTALPPEDHTQHIKVIKIPKTKAPIKKYGSNTKVYLQEAAEAGTEIALAVGAGASLVAVLEVMIPLICEVAEVAIDVVQEVASHIRSSFSDRTTMKYKQLETAVKEHLRTEGAQFIADAQNTVKEKVDVLADTAQQHLSDTVGRFTTDVHEVQAGCFDLILNAFRTAADLQTQATQASNHFVAKKLHQNTNQKLADALAKQLNSENDNSVLYTQKQLHNQLKVTTSKAALKAFEQKSKALAQKAAQMSSEEDASSTSTNPAQEDTLSRVTIDGTTDNGANTGTPALPAHVANVHLDVMARLAAFLSASHQGHTNAQVTDHHDINLQEMGAGGVAIESF